MVLKSFLSGLILRASPTLNWPMANISSMFGAEPLADAFEGVRQIQSEDVQRRIPMLSRTWLVALITVFLLNSMGAAETGILQLEVRDAVTHYAVQSRISLEGPKQL